MAKIRNIINGKRYDSRREEAQLKAKTKML